MSRPGPRSGRFTGARVMPADLAHRWVVRPLQVRRVLRSLYGTLRRQDRGPRWCLTPVEVARVTAEAKRRGWC
jgi:hypothetical protein